MRKLLARMVIYAYKQSWRIETTFIRLLDWSIEGAIERFGHYVSRYDQENYQMGQIPSEAENPCRGYKENTLLQ